MDSKLKQKLSSNMKDDSRTKFLKEFKKHKKVILTLVISLFILTGGILTLSYLNNYLEIEKGNKDSKTQTSENKHSTKTSEKKNSIYKSSFSTSLPSKDINRLQNYPYKVPPKLGFNEIVKQRPKLAKLIVDNLFKKVIIFEAGEHFLTNENLTYLTKSHHYIIRGVYQRKAENGTITEQDYAFEYYYGGWGKKQKYYYVGERALSEEKVVKGGN